MGHTNIRKQEDSWEYCLYTGDCHEPYGVNCFFSTSISSAWLVVEKLGGKGVGVDKYLDENGVLYWEVGFFMKSPGRADTAPLAICRAAIKACVA